MTPPRQLLVLMRMTRSRFGLSILQFSTNRFLYPPEISLPTTTPPCPSFISQLRTMIFSLGTFHFRPSAFRPLLMAMQSSPVSNIQFSINTFLLDSGSQPSLLGPWLDTLTPRTVRLSQNKGWITQNGEFFNVTFSIKIVLQRYRLISWGRKPSSKVIWRLSIGANVSAYISNLFLPPFFWAVIPSFQP